MLRADGAAGPPEGGAGVRDPAGAPRVLALCVPALPLQRLLRARPGDPAAGGQRRPLAILSEGRVVHCDAAARAAGVRPGHTAAEALSACGRLEGVPLDEATDRAALRALAEAVLLLAPAVEVSAPDVLLLDASAAHLLAPAGAGPEAAERVLAGRALAAAAGMGYAARAAVASGRAPAAALARHPAGHEPLVPGPQGSPAPQRYRRVPPGGVAQALAGLPLESLGLGPAVVGRLRALGVADAGALVALPPGSLAHRFGPEGVRAARLARGEDGGPLVPYAPETLPEEALDLEGPAESADPLLFALKQLADRVSARLAGRGLGATRLRVTLKLDPRGEERIAVPLAQPTASAARWLTPMKELVFSLRLPGAVVALKLAALEVAALPAEQLAFGDRPEALAALETVMARLATRLGDGALFAAEPVERYRPEGAYRTVPFQRGRPAGARGGVKEAAHPERRPAEGGPESRDRPTRLLARPLHVVAEGEGGRLTALHVEGRTRAVLDLHGPERLQGEWWGGAAGPGGAAGFDRDYFRIRLEELGECWVYRDGVDGRLWLHGFFD